MTASGLVEPRPCDTLLHRPPDAVLLNLVNAGVLIPLEPVAKPVHVALIDGQVVSRLDLDVRLVRIDVDICPTTTHQGDRVIERHPILLLGELEQNRGAYSVDLISGRELLPPPRRLFRRRELPLAPELGAEFFSQAVEQV